MSAFRKTTPNHWSYGTEKVQNDATERCQREKIERRKGRKKKGKAFTQPFVFILATIRTVLIKKYDFGWPVFKNPGRYISAPMVQPSVYVITWAGRTRKLQVLKIVLLATYVVVRTRHCQGTGTLLITHFCSSSALETSKIHCMTES